MGELVMALVRAEEDFEGVPELEADSRIHVHLRVWWRDVSDLHTYYLCARFDHGPWLREFLAVNRVDPAWLYPDGALGDAIGCDTDTRDGDRSVLVRVGDHRQDLDRRVSSGGAAADLVRLRRLDCCEHFGRDSIGWGESVA